jgi:hypothetical protein
MKMTLLAITLVCGAALPSTVAARDIPVYPSGAPDGDGNDTGRIIEAIEAADPGDVIVLKSVNLTGDPTPFVLGMTRSTQITIFTPGTPPEGKIFKGGLLFSPAYQLISVPKALTFRGDGLDGSGVPRTVIRQKATDVLALGVPGSGFVLHNEQRSRFEGLKFEHMIAPIIAFAPFDMIGCYVTDSIGAFEPWYDIRTVYPGFDADDFTVENRSTVEGCTLESTRVLGHVWNSALTLRCNKVLDVRRVGQATPLRALQVSSDPSIAAFVFPDLGASAPLIPYVRSVEISGNTFENTNSTPTALAGMPYEATFFAQNGGALRNISLTGNTFRNTKGTVGAIRLAAFPGAEIDGFEIVGNTFVGNRQASRDISCNSAARITNVLISGNTHLDSFRAGAASKQVVVLDLLAAGAELSRVSLVKNDYRLSGFPPHQGLYSRAVVALGSGVSSCTVFEAGSFPEDQGGARFFVKDLGIANRIVGESANTDAEPGIGDGVAEAMPLVGFLDACVED